MTVTLIMMAEVAIVKTLYPQVGFFFLVSLKGDISGEKRIMYIERIRIVLDNKKTSKDVSKPDRLKKSDEIGRGA